MPDQPRRPSLPEGRDAAPERDVATRQDAAPGHGAVPEQQTDRMATVLLRLARDPASGRIRHRMSLDVALRAALFADLTLAGRIANRDMAPFAVSDEPTGDRFLDAVRRAVAGRPGVAWVRWFRHVSTDRTALRDELVRQGRWARQGGWPRSYSDSEPDAVLAIAGELDRVIRLERPPADAREATLAVLAAVCGAAGHRPRPVAVKQDLAGLVDAIPDESTRIAVRSAARALRKTRPGGSLR